MEIAWLEMEIVRLELEIKITEKRIFKSFDFQSFEI